MGGANEKKDLQCQLDEVTALCVKQASLIEKQATQIGQLKDFVIKLKKMVFGPKSEKRPLTGNDLLPFPELLADKEAFEKAQKDAKEIQVPAHTRKPQGRRAEFPEHLPREDSVYVLPDSLMTCACGCQLREIGEKITQEIERIETCFIHRIIRKKYSCPKCQDGVLTAEGPDRVLDKCLLGAAFLAQIIYERFGNHMPYARLEAKYKDEGLGLARSVMCRSVQRCAELLEPVYKAVRVEVLASDVIQSDDTEVLQRDGPNKGRKKVNLWVYRNQDGGMFFDVTDKRNRDGPAAVLQGFAGLLQCDGHECYDDVGNGLVRVGCWAHMRRKFIEAKDSGDKLADEAIDLIRTVFFHEKQARQSKMRGNGLWEFRQKHVKPVVDRLHEWVELRHAETASLPKGPLMKAIGYARNQWPTLIRFLEHGRILDITNNASERALRPTVIGRRNWCFFGSEGGAKTAAILMSLVNSCKDLGVNPLLYLRWALRQISSVRATDVESLTPRGWLEEQKEFEAARASHRVVSDIVEGLLAESR